MNNLEKILTKLADFQGKHAKYLLVIFILISLFMIAGLPQIRMQSDLSKTQPDNLPINFINDGINDKFGTQGVVLIVLTIDDASNSKDLPKDIRDVSVINYLIDIQNSLELESSIDEVTSLGGVFSNFNDLDQNTINSVFETNEQLNGFISKDYKTTFVLVSTDASGEEKVTAITNLINEKIDSYAKPPGTKIVITGNPPMQVTLLRILARDAVFTLTVAFILIFLLLIVMERSFPKAVLVSIPLVVGLLWTMGTMAWIGLEISIATAGLGAMLLGLGVEYGVFMLTRYREARRDGKSSKDSLKVAVPGVGSAIMGSGLTTTTGFLALTLSIMPVLRDLGLSLALGIIYCLISAVFMAPVVYIIFEHAEEKVDTYLVKLLNKRITKIK